MGTHSTSDFMSYEVLPAIGNIENLVYSNPSNIQGPTNENGASQVFISNPQYLSLQTNQNITSTSNSNSGNTEVALLSNDSSDTSEGLRELLKSWGLENLFDMFKGK